MLKLRLVRGNTGADDNQVLIAKGSLAVLAGFNDYTAVQQRRNFALQLCFCFGIGNRNACATLLQKKC